MFLSIFFFCSLPPIHFHLLLVFLFYFFFLSRLLSFPALGFHLSYFFSPRFLLSSIFRYILLLPSHPLSYFIFFFNSSSSIFHVPLSSLHHLSFLLFHFISYLLFPLLLLSFLSSILQLILIYSSSFFLSLHSRLGL